MRSARGELIRTFVNGYGGDWEHARRRLSAAHGDIARAIVALKRTPQRKRQPASLPSCHRHGPGPVAARPGREGSPGQFWLMGEVSVTAFNLNTEENPPGWRKSLYSFPHFHVGGAIFQRVET